MPDVQAVRIYARHIPEHVIPGKRLGRHVLTDSRSAAYRHQAPPGRTASAQLWPRHIGILDQGNTGSCTGNAECGALGTGPLWDALPAGHPVLDERFARDVLYHLATQDDPYPGTYPPDDTGSDGISVSKAALGLGLISGYTHCTDIAGMEDALQDGPVAVGVNWYDSFDSPSSDGTVAISPGAQVRGGHEFLVRGTDPAARMFRADNSWGPGWGDAGSFQFSYATMDRLLAEQGDCTVPLPLTVSPPTPTPAPGDADAAFAAVLLEQNATGQAWVDQRHVHYVAKVAIAGRIWLDAKGLG